MKLGEFVELYSGQELPFVAQITKIDGTKILCRWLWRPSDLPADVQTGFSFHPRELVLGTLADWNDTQAVLGVANVVHFSQSHLTHGYFFKFIFDQGLNTLRQVTDNDGVVSAAEGHSQVEGAGLMNADVARQPIISTSYYKWEPLKTLPKDKTRQGIIGKFQAFFQQAFDEVNVIEESMVDIHGGVRDEGSFAQTNHHSSTLLGTRSEAQSLAARLEQELHAQLDSFGYKSQTRSLLFNLGKFPDLRRKLVEGRFSVSGLVHATADELAGEDLVKQRKAQQEKYLREQVMVKTSHDKVPIGHDFPSRHQEDEQAGNLYEDHSLPVKDIEMSHLVDAPIFAAPPRASVRPSVRSAEEPEPKKIKVENEPVSKARVLAEKLKQDIRDKLESSSIRDRIFTSIKKLLNEIR